MVLMVFFVPLPFPLEIAFMAAFETVIELVKAWQPDELPTELKYRDSLTALLRDRLRDTKIETEYRHAGTTTDIYVEQPGFFGKTEVFVELKRNLLQKAQLDRLIGQLESLEPKRNSVIVIVCGETNPALVTRFKQKYGITDSSETSWGWRLALIVKRPGEP
jgi:hypothetical protein